MSRISISKTRIGFLSEVFGGDALGSGGGYSWTYNDKGLWRRPYSVSGKTKSYFCKKLTDKNDLEKYKNPVLVLDGKEYDYLSVTKPSGHGISIIYKAKMVPLNYDTVYLDFKDIHNMDRRVAYNVSKIWPQIPDTFLLFNNEVNAPDFVVCAKQLNTPENWKMISDYGYIFDYDIFSKEEIEDRFPEVKKYAEELRSKSVQ